MSPSMSLQPNLSRLVREGRWSDLEEAWTEHLLAGGASTPALEAVAAAAQRREIARCLPLVRDHAEVLVASERSAEAAELLGEAMLGGGSPGELAKPLFQAVRAAWESSPFFEIYSEVAGLRENAPDMRAAWKSFKKLLALEPDRVVHHAKGWGLGRIEALDLERREIQVCFQSGLTDRFPLRTAVEIFEVFDPRDLRALVVTQPAELERLLKKDPLAVLRWIVEKNGGRATQAAIKLAAGSLGIDGSRYTAWWKAAKKEAEASPWFELSGSSNKVLVRLLHEASDPSEAMRRALARSRSLAEALVRVRALAQGAAGDGVVLSVGLSSLEELAADGSHPLPDRLATWIFLREIRGQTPALLAELCRERARTPRADPTQIPPLWALFHAMPGSREQERCVDLLQEVFGASWIEEAARNFLHSAPGMARGLVEALENAGRTQELVGHYTALLARPARNPSLLVRLAERIEHSTLPHPLPSPAQRAQCLLQLAVHLFRNSPGDSGLTRTRMRLSEILVEGNPPLLKRLLAEVDLDGLRALATLIEGAVERDVDRLFTRIAIEKSPDVFRGEERPFWEGPTIWTLRTGLRRQEEELRTLREVKIPANSEAIGKAASYGDLSENSEWEAAIEDQRHLTSRAMELETEIRRAQMIEHAPIPHDTVSPGTRVRYREQNGVTHEIELVGPWDVERENQVSYRSPLGQGLLGLHPGGRATVELPNGRLGIEVLWVEPLSF